MRMDHQNSQEPKKIQEGPEMRTVGTKEYVHSLWPSEGRHQVMPPRVQRMALRTSRQLTAYHSMGLWRTNISINIVVLGTLKSTNGMAGTSP